MLEEINPKPLKVLENEEFKTFDSIFDKNQSDETDFIYPLKEIEDEIFELDKRFEKNGETKILPIFRKDLEQSIVRECYDNFKNTSRIIKSSEDDNLNETVTELKNLYSMLIKPKKEKFSIKKFEEKENLPINSLKNSNDSQDKIKKTKSSLNNQGDKNKSKINNIFNEQSTIYDKQSLEKKEEELNQTKLINLSEINILSPYNEKNKTESERREYIYLTNVLEDDRSYHNFNNNRDPESMDHNNEVLDSNSNIFRKKNSDCDISEIPQLDSKGILNSLIDNANQKNGIFDDDVCLAIGDSALEKFINSKEEDCRDHTKNFLKKSEILAQRFIDYGIKSKLLEHIRLMNVNYSINLVSCFKQIGRDGNRK